MVKLSKRTLMKVFAGIVAVVALGSIPKIKSSLKKPEESEASSEKRISPAEENKGVEIALNNTKDEEDDFYGPLIISGLPPEDGETKIYELY